MRVYARSAQKNFLNWLQILVADYLFSSLNKCHLDKCSLDKCHAKNFLWAIVPCVPIRQILDKCIVNKCPPWVWTFEKEPSPLFMFSKIRWRYKFFVPFPSCWWVLPRTWPARRGAGIDQTELKEGVGYSNRIVLFGKETSRTGSFKQRGYLKSIIWHGVHQFVRGRVPN